MLRSQLSSELRTSEAVRPLIGRVDGPLLHVMSFNLRNAGPNLPDPWTERRPVAAALLEAERPTVIGTQEGLYQQLREFGDDLPSGYEWVGTGRDGGSRGEFMAIYFDAYRLRPQEFDHFWLSDTPDVVGSTSWGNDVIRMATWVRFLDLSTEREFVLLDTHLDHAVEAARQKGATLLNERIREFDAGQPVIVTGDFNAPAERSVAYDILVGDADLRDTWTAADQRLTARYATFHGYRPPVEDGDRIDWILTSPDIWVRSAAINTTTVDGRHASDHWPVQSVLQLP